MIIDHKEAARRASESDGAGSAAKDDARDAARDAARYRWLRDNSQTIGVSMTKLWSYEKRRYVTLWREKLDAAIDAAMFPPTVGSESDE